MDCGKYLHQYKQILSNMNPFLKATAVGLFPPSLQPGGIYFISLPVYNLFSIKVRSWLKLNNTSLKTTIPLNKLTKQITSRMTNDHLSIKVPNIFKSQEKYQTVLKRRAVLTQTGQGKCYIQNQAFLPLQVTKTKSKNLKLKVNVANKLCRKKISPEVVLGCN